MKEDNSEFDAQISNLRDVFRGFMYIGNISASDKVKKVLKKNGWEMISIVPHSIHINPANGSVSYHYPIKIKNDTTNHVAYLVMHAETDNFIWINVVAKSNVNGCVVKKQADAVRRRLEEAHMEMQTRLAKRGIKKCTRKRLLKQPLGVLSQIVTYGKSVALWRNLVASQSHLARNLHRNKMIRRLPRLSRNANKKEPSPR
jgi:hypothetical protein